MQQPAFRALVVDDEASIRQLTARALSRRGFQCDVASDGLEAQELLADTRYDVVVTDLRMPRRHGHSLAVDLLSRDQRPVVVVLTGVAEPKLANDLVVRGVDDVMFKPVDYDFLALKTKALAERRRQATQDIRGRDAAPLPLGPLAAEGAGRGGAGAGSTSPGVDIDAQLAHLSKLLPVSQAAFDVFAMANSNGYDSQQIAAAIARDPSLSVDVLRLANSAYYNASGKKVVELEGAVVRIGQKHIGELALATSALAALTANVLPWMNVGLAWRRSVAAGVAVDLLQARRTSAPDDAGIFLSTIMHPLGRIAMGMLFPEQYRKIIEVCRRQDGTLLEQERRQFPLSHGEVMSRLLDRWNIPAAAHEALRHVTDDYAAVVGLGEPLRTKVELVKVAVLIGRTAVGQWEAWDSLEFPPDTVLRRLKVDSLAEIVKATRRDSEDIINFRVAASDSKRSGDRDREPDAAAGQIAYCNLSEAPFDFLAAVVGASGFRLRRIESRDLHAEEKTLVNCLGVPPERLQSRLNPPTGDMLRVLVSDGTESGPPVRHGEVLEPPLSFSRLEAACRRLAGADQSVAAGSGAAVGS